MDEPTPVIDSQEALDAANAAALSEEKNQQAADNTPDETQNDLSNDADDDSAGDTADSDDADDQDDASDGSDQDSTDDTDQDDLEVWMKSQGIDPENPTKEDLAKLAKRVKDNQKAFSKGQQEQSELKKQLAAASTKKITGELSVTDQDDSDDDEDLDDSDEAETKESPVVTKLALKVAEMESDSASKEFWSKHEYTPELDRAMGEVVAKHPSLAEDLESAFVLARKDLAPALIRKAKSDGSKETVKSLARRKAASTPQSTARTAEETGGGELTDEAIGKMSTAEFDAAVKAGKIDGILAK